MIDTTIETVAVPAIAVEIRQADAETVSSSGRGRAITAAHQSPASGLWARGFSDGSVELWDAGGERLVRAFGVHKASIETLAFSLDGQSLASRSADDEVVLWDVRTGERNHKSRQYAVVRYGAEGPLDGVLGPYEEIGMVVLRNGDYATVHTTS